MVRRTLNAAQYPRKVTVVWRSLVLLTVQTPNCAIAKPDARKMTHDLSAQHRCYVVTDTRETHSRAPERSQRVHLNSSCLGFVQQTF